MWWPVSGRLDRLFAPVWAGTWDLTRWGFGLAAALATWIRLPQIQDALAHPLVAFGGGLLGVFDRVMISAGTAHALWGLCVLGLGALLFGGRAAKPGLVLWLVAYLGLLMGLGLEARVPERLFILGAAGLLAGPMGERGLRSKWRSPAARWYLLLLACVLYLSTGMFKLLFEPAWFTGQTLPFNLVDRYFGLTPPGIWVSAQPTLCLLMSWYTLLFECGFALLVLFRRSNPWILLAGLGFHLGVETLMDVGPLTWTTLALYPVLLHPEVAHGWWLRLSRRGGASTATSDPGS